MSLKAALVIVALAVTGQAATIRVPSQQPTIQAGIDAAGESDTVLVAPGTYTGPGNHDILMDSKGLVVRSEAGPAATIIDCEGNGRGFTLEGPMALDPVIEGFTIKNGYTVFGGGGLIASDCSPSILNCMFIGNRTGDYGNGGAIYAGCDLLVISNCVFSGNMTGGRGGALSLKSGAGSAARESRLTSCTFVGNMGDFSVYFHQGDINTSFELCVMTENQGILLYFGPSGPNDPGSVTLECCDIYGNELYQWYNEPFDWLPHPTISEQAQLAGNFSQPPLYCDLDNDFYSVHDASPLLAENNSCGVNIGCQIVMGCSDCRDDDGDGLCAVNDNCPLVANLPQLDADLDGIGDACEDEDGDGILSPVDNCVLVNNANQEDKDLDGMGDVCDDDIDGDGYANESDNCPVNHNPGQDDRNSDGVGDACCCVDRVGDANGLGGAEPTIGDVAILINALYIRYDYSILPCLSVADINQSGGCNPTESDITIGDIAKVIGYLFIATPPIGLPDCLDCP